MPSWITLIAVVALFAGLLMIITGICQKEPPGPGE